MDANRAAPMEQLAAGPGRIRASARLELALATFAVARSGARARVAALDEAGRVRFGRHATSGRLDVAGLLGVIFDHDDHHLADIAALAGVPRSR